MVCLQAPVDDSPWVLLIAVHYVGDVRCRGGGLQVLVEASSSCDGLRRILMLTGVIIGIVNRPTTETSTFHIGTIFMTF